MLAKQIISLLVLPGLMVLPAGIASAGDIDVLTDDLRVIVDEDVDLDEDIEVYLTPSQRRTIYPLRLPTSRMHILQNRLQRFRIWKTPKTSWKTHRTTSTPYCYGRTITRQSTQSRSSGTGTNRTYSYTSTRSSCQ